MKVMAAGLLGLAVTVMAGCDAQNPGQNVNLNADSGGVSGSARVVDTDNVDVKVGTGGPSASVRPGGGPVKLGVGKRGLRIGI